MKLVEQYGTPLKFTYLPQISNINKAKSWFRKSMEKNKYEAKYYYCIAQKLSF
jgi:arginine decarboxylase